MGTLDIRLLGGFELVRDGRPLEQLPLRAARSLLAYLALNRDRAHTRDLLAGTFWPEFDDSRARRRLSQALWQIQSSVGEHEGQRYLIGTADSVRFNPEAEFSIDVEEFERLLDAGDPDSIERAVSLYRGDLLAGWYDDWILEEQGRVRRQFLTGLERLIDVVMAKGDHESALAHARRLAQEDEFDEEAHRRVMRIAVLLGRHTEAIRQFEECRRILEEELGTQPSAETIALYQKTLEDRDTGGRTAPVPDESPLFEEVRRSPFIGRDAERSQLARRLDEVLDGGGGMVLLEGESGVGKTRLLAEVVEDATWRGMDVLWGRSTPTGGRPFAPIASALAGVTGLRARQVANRLDESWQSALAPLAPELAGDPAEAVTAPVRRADEQARMREAITRAFQSLGAIAPTLVVLEDVHWADDDTITALDHMAGQLVEDRVLVIVSYRHGEARERSEVWNLLRSLDRLPNCERVSIAPLSPAQTEELIRRSLGRPEVSGDFSDRLHRDTGGLPLFIVETLRALYEKDDLYAAELDAEEAPPSRDRLPVTPVVHALIRQRLEGLEPSSRRILELVSAHDGTLSLQEIVSGSELEDHAALSAVDDLVKRRLVDGEEGEFSVDHELMRRVVYDDLKLSRKLELHRRIALSLEEHQPEEVELLAHHFTTARMPERAVDYLEKAAERAMSVHAYDTAALHLERASATLDEISAEDARRFSVSSLLEEVYDVLGRREEQGHALQRMERHSQGAEAVDTMTRRAWWLAHQDRFDEAVDTARAAFDEAGAGEDSGRAIAALTALGMIACFVGKAAEGVEFLEQAADFKGVTPRQEADARNALGQNLIDLQRFGEAESQLVAALSIYESMGDARGEAEVLGMLATLRMERGEPDAAERDYLRAIEISKRIGYRHGEAVYQMNLGILYGITNRLGDSLRTFDESAVAYGRMGNSRGRALVESNAAWFWHALVGDDDRANEMARSALEVYDAIGDDRGRAQCIALLGSTAARSGDFESAEALFDQSIDLTVEAKDSWLEAQGLRHFAAAELEADRIDSGLDHALRAETLCRDFGLNDLLVSVRAVIGRLYIRKGDLDKAYTYADKAIREVRPGLEYAHLIPFAMGEVLEARGEPDSALEYFVRSHEQLMATLQGLPTDLLEISLTAVPAHRVVHEKWRSQQPETATVLLPSSSAPTGRTLRDNDHVPVTWTLHHPDDNRLDNQMERRRAILLRLVEEAEAQDAAPTIDHLATALGASSATVRRDIAELRKAGTTVNTRGHRS